MSIEIAVIISIVIYIFGLGVLDYITDHVVKVSDAAAAIFIAFWPIAWIGVLGYYSTKLIYYVGRRLYNI